VLAQRRGRALAGLVLLAALSAYAQADSFDPPKVKRTVTATRAAQPPVIDGVLDEAVWADATSAGDFVQIEPVQRGKATHASVVKVLFDDDNLYVSARLEQPGGWSAFNQRNLRRDFAGNECDSFGVLLDTFGDGRNAFSFQVNPWGAQRDMQVLDDSLYEDKWDTLWRSATTRDEQGWVVEIAIPWKSLRYTQQAAKFGVQFYRRERGMNEDTAWSAYPRTLSPWRMSYAGVLEGLAPPPPRVFSLQVRPYAIGRVAREGDAPFSVAPSAGGEVTWSPTSSAVVDLTANTDFAETDVDHRVVNLSRFSVFFPERRQFFLESAGAFSSGFEGFLQPFFSRAIGLSDDGERLPILAGVRAVYRTVERTAAALVVSTLATPTAQASLFGVARYTHNLGEENHVGGMVVLRHDLGRPGDDAKTNVVPVLDGLFRAGPFTFDVSGMGSASTVGSAVRYGGAGTFNAHVQGNWGNLYANFFGTSPDFQARTGFIARNNMLGGGLGGSIDLRPAWLPKSVRDFGPFFDLSAIWSADKLAFQELNVTFAPMWVQLAGGDEAWLGVEKSTQVLTDTFAPVPGVSFKPGTYEYDTVDLSVVTQASRKVAGSVGVALGRYYSAQEFRSGLTASVQPLPHVQVSGSWAYNRFWGQGVTGLYAETHLLLVETRLALNPKLQLIASFQRDTAGNAQVVNARLAWEFQPLSFVYLVFTDTRGAYRAPDGSPPGQQLVAKVTYTWRP
jgi:hypothetical protein